VERSRHFGAPLGEVTEVDYPQRRVKVIVTMPGLPITGSPQAFTVGTLSAPFVLAGRAGSEMRRSTHAKIGLGQGSHQEPPRRYQGRTRNLPPPTG